LAVTSAPPPVRPPDRASPAAEPRPGPTGGAAAAETAGAALADAPAGKTFMGQPRPLSNLFSVEMWERFSFYGMQGILLIYMYFQTGEGGLGIDEGVAAGIVGAYGGMVYVFCILGGWVADRITGSERAMFYSAILIMAGHISLALVPGIPGLVLGLLLVAIGSGVRKATVANLVGHL